MKHIRGESLVQLEIKKRWVRMHSHNREYSVETSCHVSIPPSKEIESLDEDDLIPNLMELGKFVKRRAMCKLHETSVVLKTEIFEGSA